MPPSPKSYPAPLAGVLDPGRLPPLGSGRPNEPVRGLLAGLDHAALADGRRIRDREMVDCCLAGLWLLHDFLDESHTISQGIETSSGSYWHGIMHRREPDFWNSKYWFRRVGRHPVFPDLLEAARAISDASAPRGAQVARGARLATGAEADVICRPASDAARRLIESSEWNPPGFVDLCEAAHEGRAPDGEWCRRVAREEWWLLFDYCYRQGVET